METSENKILKKNLLKYKEQRVVCN